MIITIDGPVASGKSSVAQLLAERLGFYHVNTGLLYRAVAYVECEKLSLEAALDDISSITYTFQNGQPVVQYRLQDITPYLKEARFDQAASRVSANPLVRKALLEVQHAMGKKFNIIADGRDCGSVVYPDADYKFFLTAPLKTRTVRMAKYLCQKTGKIQDVAAIGAHIAERDTRDSERAIAPLCVPAGAIVIDNGEMTIEQTVDVMVGYIKINNKKEKQP